MRNIISDQLLSGIRNMSAQGGEEIESRDDMRRGGIGRARPVMIPGIVGDLGGFGQIAQNVSIDVFGKQPGALLVA